MTTKKQQRRTAIAGTPLTKNLSLIALFLTVGIPLVTLVSMVASYKDHVEQSTAEIDTLKKEVTSLQNNSGLHSSDIEVFKQNIMDNSRDIDALKRGQDGYDEKILQVWKETSGNEAQIESLKTEVLWLKSNQERDKK